MATITLAYVTQFKDRHGKTRFRFRKKGCAPAMLHGEPGSDRFMADYAQAMARAASVEPIGSSRTIPVSLSALICATISSIVEPAAIVRVLLALPE